MIFSQFDVYDKKYTYDEMKVMCVLSAFPDIDSLGYEDLMRICEAVYSHWIDGRDSSENEKYENILGLNLNQRKRTDIFKHMHDV